jgi:hypothetical protein
MNVDRVKLMSLVDKYATARERAVVASDRAERAETDALDAKRDLDAYLDECVAKTPGEGPSILELASKMPAYEPIPLVQCLACKHAVRVDNQPNAYRCAKGRMFDGIGRVPCKEYEAVDGLSEARNREAPAPKTETPTEAGPEVSCIECAHSERVDAATNTWHCKKGHPFAGFWKVRCGDFEQWIEKPHCGRCKHFEQNDESPDTGKCPHDNGSIPTGRWQPVCDKFEEAKP